MAGDDFPKYPPKPRLALRIGITGKREITAEVAKRIRADLESVFEALTHFLVDCRAKNEGSFSAELPLLRVVSGMAEGADQIAADVAVMRFDAEQASANRAVETRFAAILPFAQAEFEKDFRRDPNNNEGLRSESAWRQVVGDFRAALDKPAVESVLQIDDAAIRDSTNPADRTLAYANLRDLILEHADILVAVSDDVDGGTGGTVDAIRRAVRTGIPTIKISTAKPKIFLMRSAQPDAVDQTPVEDEEFKRVSDPSGQLVLPEKVTTALAGFLEPPRPTAAEGVETHAHDRATHARFEQYFDEKFEPVWFGRIFRAFSDAVTAWPKSSRKNRVRLAAAAFFRTLRNHRVEPPAEKLSTSWPTSESGTLFTDERNNKRLQRIHATRLAWADALAIVYADVVRSSHVAMAFWSTVAVFVALLGVVFADYISPYAKIVMLYLEALIVFLAVRNFLMPLEYRDWTGRMIEYRVIAELLRHQVFLRSLGAANRLTVSRSRVRNEPGGWVIWYVESTVRELGIPTGILSANHCRQVLALFSRREIEPQVEYNAAVAARYSMLDDRLEFVARHELTVGPVLFGGASAIAILYALEMAQLRIFSPGHWVVDLLKALIALFVIGGALLVSAVNNLRNRLEFSATAKRAELTRTELAEIRETIEGDFLRPGSQPQHRLCVEVIRSANQVMAADLGGWSTIYRHKIAGLP